MNTTTTDTSSSLKATSTSLGSKPSLAWITGTAGLAATLSTAAALTVAFTPACQAVFSAIGGTLGAALIALAITAIAAAAATVARVVHQQSALRTQKTDHVRGTQPSCAD